MIFFSQICHTKEDIQCFPSNQDSKYTTISYASISTVAFNNVSHKFCFKKWWLLMFIKISSTCFFNQAVWWVVLASWNASRYQWSKLCWNSRHVRWSDNMHQHGRLKIFANMVRRIECIELSLCLSEDHKSHLISHNKHERGIWVPNYV